MTLNEVPFANVFVCCRAVLARQVLGTGQLLTSRLVMTRRLTPQQYMVLRKLGLESENVKSRSIAATA